MIRLEEGSSVNIGLIGFGSIGRIHANAIRSLESLGLKLGGIADPRPASKIPGIPFYVDYWDLLAREDIQAVSIATPPVTHKSIVFDALNAGKNVLVEKPPALSIKDIEEMALLATDIGSVLFMGWHARYHPEVELAKQELVGKHVRKIDIAYAEDVSRYHDSIGWIFDPKIAGGGVLMDSGINAISIVTDLLPGKELTVINSTMHYPERSAVETWAQVDFSFGSETKGVLNMDWAHRGPEIRRIILFTDNDEYTINIVTGELVKNGNVIFGNGGEGVVVDQLGEYQRMYRDFQYHLLKGGSKVSTRELKFVLDAYEKAIR